MKNGLTAAALAEVSSLVTDGAHDTPKRVEGGFPLIKAKEIGDGWIDFETCDQTSESDHQKVIARSKPERFDTPFAHIGASLGEAALVRTREEFSIKNVALFKPDPKKIDGRYLYYLVISPEFQDPPADPGAGPSGAPPVDRDIHIGQRPPPAAQASSMD